MVLDWLVPSVASSADEEDSVENVGWMEATVEREEDRDCKAAGVDRAEAGN
jgi:hypothetical protein